MNFEGKENEGSYGPIIAIGRETVVLNNENFMSSPKGKNSHGFHLMKSKWDPYPWIAAVDSESSAEFSGLRSGDCLLKVDGRDVIGLEMKDIAYLIQRNELVNLSLWRGPLKSNLRASNVDRIFLEDAEIKKPDDFKADPPEILLEGPLPDVTYKLVKAVSGLVKALECPVCLDSAAPPVSQCVHGHLLCFGCRLKTSRCPVCRVRLGQGRCLLADKSHRVLKETLTDAENRVLLGEKNNLQYIPLQENIVGSSNHLQKRKCPKTGFKTKDLVSKFLSSSRQMNVSTESLPTTNCAMNRNLYGRRWLLRLYDRTKSASMGELNRDGPYRDSNDMNGSYSELHDETQDTIKFRSLLIVPQTVMWSGSTEFIVTDKFNCPLKKHTGCQKCINSNTLIEHLSEHSGPLIHFYKKNFTLPVPFPFQDEAIYILHYKDENFILLNEKNKIWISNFDKNCTMNWQWIVYAVTKNGTEIHLQKEVYNLRESFELSSRHIAVLPNLFSGSSVRILLTKLNTNNGYIKV